MADMSGVRDAYFSVIYGHGGRWEGLCLDLDIAVEGRSLSEVKSLLSEAVSTYIADALKEDEPTRSALLNRKVPLRVRLYWAAMLALATLRGTNRDDDMTVRYPVPCHT